MSHSSESHPHEADDLAPDVRDLLDRREVEVTRSVTRAVTADLEARHASALSVRDARIAQLEEELSALHHQLHAAQQRIERLERDPSVRVVRFGLRALRGAKRRLR